MSKKILINKHNPEFYNLMVATVKAVRANDVSAINHVKTKFQEGNIAIAYNKESDKIELLEQGFRPVVLNAKDFE